MYKNMFFIKYVKTMGFSVLCPETIVKHSFTATYVGTDIRA